MGRIFRTESWKRLFEVVIFISALTLFSIQIKDVVAKFFDGRTTIAMREEILENYFLPDITFHVHKGFKFEKFKELGLYAYHHSFDSLPKNVTTDEHVYYETTYVLGRDVNITMIIPSFATVSNIQVGENKLITWGGDGSDKLDVIRTNSRAKGLYYTLRLNAPLKIVSDNDKIWIQFKFNEWDTDKKAKVHGYVSDASEYYRYVNYAWNGVKKLTFNVHPTRQVALHITKTTRKSLSQGDKDKCHHYKIGTSMTKCRLEISAATARKYMEANCSSICTNPPFATLMSLANVNQSHLCSTKQDARCMFDGYYQGSRESSKENKLKCLPACTKVEYYGEIENVEVTGGDLNYAWTSIQFDSDKERVYEELLLFDLSSFIGNVGGSLGLFIGFSYFQFAKRMSSTFVDFFSSRKK